MKSYLISVPLGDPAPAGVRHSLHTQDYNNGTEMRSLWDCINASDPTPGNAYLIGSWDMASGDLLSPLHDDFFLGDVRPLGNNPEQVIYDDQGEPVDVIPAGLATKHLRYAYWDTAGMKARKLDQGGKLYPADNQPFPGIMGRMYWPEISHPNKHGWQFELVWDFDETLRNPAQVFIGVFSDADCTQYLYQVGAMYLGTSAFQFDENGNPRTVWVQNSFNFPTLEPETIHFAICNSHITYHEGRATLSEGEEIEEDLYWADNQPSPESVVQFLADVYGTGPQVSVASTLPLTWQQKTVIRLAMRDAGVPIQDIVECAALKGQVTAKEAFLGLLACIYNGIITYPPSS